MIGLLSLFWRFCIFGPQGRRLQEDRERLIQTMPAIFGACVVEKIQVGGNHV